MVSFVLNTAILWWLLGLHNLVVSRLLDGIMCFYFLFLRDGGKSS